MATVRVRNLTKRFKDVYAVRDLNLEVRDKEFLALLGPSGCGKTTTLNMIAGLEMPTSGQILIDDRPVTHVPAAQRDIAMVFQNYALYPHMTVYGNMAFALKIRKTPKDVIQKQVNEAANVLGITALLDRYPRQLSGGQRQRVALGRAIVRQPKVFLLDEPLSNLDAVLRVQMRAELKILFNRLEATVVYVTHDQAEAMTMSDRVAIFKNGVLQQIDTPLAIYHTPTNQFVAGFVGSPPMNFLDVTVTPEGKLCFVDILIDPPADAALTLRRYVGQTLVLGIRPEDIHLTGDAGVPCIVQVVEQLGSSTLLYMNLHERLIAVQTSGGTRLKIGERHHIALIPQRLYLFEGPEGNAIRTPGVEN